VFKKPGEDSQTMKTMKTLAVDRYSSEPRRQKLFCWEFKFNHKKLFFQHDEKCQMLSSSQNTSLSDQAH